MRFYDPAEKFETVRYDYDGRADGQVVYAGYAHYKDADEDKENWVIYKYTFNVSDFITHRRVGTGSWTDRATLSYE